MTESELVRLVILIVMVGAVIILDDIRTDLRQNNDYLAKLVEINGKK